MLRFNDAELFLALSLMLIQHLEDAYLPRKKAHQNERGVWGHGMADLLIKRIKWP